MSFWKIKMNINKTNYMVIGKEVIISKNIQIGDELVTRVNCLKYLGVYLDEKLKFDKHIKEKNKQESRSAYSLYIVFIYYLFILCFTALSGAKNL
jgi:hypothetical protein